MAKMLASSLSLRVWLEDLPITEIYDIRIDKLGMMVLDHRFEGEGYGDDSCFINRVNIEAFIKILKYLFDQPILLRIDDGTLWLMQCIIN